MKGVCVGVEEVDRTGDQQVRYPAKLTFVGTASSRSCSRKGAISAEHKGHRRD